MYGIHNGRKKKKDGTYYPMSYSYACRSSSLAMGRECTKPQNYSENKLMGALTAIIKSLVNDKNFGRLVDVAIGQKTDVSELEEEKTLRKKELERLNRLVTQLENQLNALDYSSKAADLKEKSLNKRLDKALEDTVDIQSQLADLEAQMEKIAAAEETKKQVYGILQSFDVLFDIMDNADRKLLINELIDKIELYPRQNLSGQWIKTIHFRFPMYYNDNNEASCAVCFDLNGHFLPKKSKDESIVCLSKLADTHIELEIDPEELDTITAKVSPTYPEIKAYVMEHHGIKVSSLAIAQTKKKCGREVGECYNLPSGHGRPPTNLTPEKEAAIRVAFQYYGLI